MNVGGCIGVYVAAVHAANVTDWTVKTDDFFPYAGMLYVLAVHAVKAVNAIFLRKSVNSVHVLT